LIRDLHPQSGDSVEEFLALVETNVNEGQLRLVFFLEEAPFELRSMVDFLNRQMQKTEVLLVEAALYELGGQRVVVPRLWGFTEEARRAKKAVGPRPSAPAGETIDEEILLQRISGSNPSGAGAIQNFYKQLLSIPSVAIRASRKSHAVDTLNFGTAFYLWENGDLEFALQDRKSPEQAAFVNALRSKLTELPVEGIKEKLTKQYPRIAPGQWSPFASQVLAAFRHAIKAAEAEMRGG
jgi:hypothetical protein